MAGAATPNIQDAFINGLITLEPAGRRFLAYATPEQVEALRALNARLGEDFAANLAVNASSALSALDRPPPFANLVTLTGVGRFLEMKIIGDALAAAEGSARQDTVRAVSFLGVSLVAMLLAGLLGGAVGRSVSIPLRRLTRSADRVAHLAESELVRVVDDDSPEAAPPRLAPIEVVGRDELADFARAFGRVQETAARLVERQVASRRNIALMFRHVGRRTQNLVGRQISLIDKLESAETEPSRLRELYRLDHISSRLRRSASSLVVLSGATSSSQHVAPIEFDDLIRLGLAEIEDYTRVDVVVTTPALVTPALINDLVLLLAELMENASGFSPPGTRVVASAVPTMDGARVSVVDHGLGMSDEQIANENARITRRERLDLQPTEVLGLFVVGRLARRHGLTVVLSATEGGGVTATVDIPAALLTRRAVAAPAPPEVRHGGVVAMPVPPAPQFDPLLDRATRTIRELRPWNAFGTGSRGGTDTRLDTDARTAGDIRTGAGGGVLDRTGANRIGTGADRETVNGAGSRPSAPPSPHQRGTAPFAMDTSTMESHRLGRRVPGATLASLDGVNPARPAQMAVSSADEARDRLAQFESGIARALRDIDQQDEGRS